MKEFFQDLVISLVGLLCAIAFGCFNVIYNYIVLNSLLGWKVSQKEHDRKVAAVQRQVRNWADGDRKRKLCSARPAWKSISVNKVDKSNYNQIDIGALNDLIKLDEKNQTVTVEPGMIMGRLSRILVPKGWTIPVVPELDALTVGGLIAGGGLESSSHKYGLIQLSALEYELVLPSGEVVTCSKDNDPELFYSIVGSYATVGFLTAVTFKIIPAKKYVELDYRFCTSIESALKLIKEEGPDHEFIEGFAYSKEKHVIMFGNMVDNPSSSGKINHINRWYKKFFYLQAEQVMDKLAQTGSSKFVEYIPTIDYYHRHSRGVFWLMNNMIPLFYDSSFYMALFGWSTPPCLDCQRLLPRFIIDMWLKSRIIQDYVVPMEKAAELFQKADELLNIYPVWICPSLAIVNPTCYYISERYDKSMYIDLGFYGTLPKASKIDKRAVLRYFEKFAIERNGFQGLYADCYMSKQEFETMFDFTNYHKLRKDRNLDEAFPDVYDKICAKSRRLKN